MLGVRREVGYQDTFAITGIATTADNKPSNGTVDGVDSFDTKVYPTVDPATTKEISAPDESAKYARNVAGWSDADAYGGNEYAYEVAKNALAQPNYGTNPFASEDFTRTLYQERGAGFNLYGLA